MRAGLLAFIVATLLTVALLREPLPASSLFALLALLVVALVVLPRAWRWPTAAALAGLLWTALFAGALLERQLPADPPHRDVRLVGQIVGVPEVRPGHTLFHIAPQALLNDASVAAGAEPAEPLPVQIRLRWYGAPPPLQAGEIWQLEVRLRPPSGFLNPAGFDYQRWLFQRRIGATGYVRAAPENQRLAAPTTLHTYRQTIAAAMAEQLGDSPQLGLVQGLGVAVRDQIDDAQWRLLSHTGTAHLLAISGLHIGMVAGAVGALIAWLWGWVPGLVRRVPTLIAGTLAGMGAAIGYALLAGLTLPTQRALIMVGVFAVALLLRRPMAPWSSLLIAATLVLLVDPWAPLGAGFWLSFAAVAVIFLATLGRARGFGLWAWLRIQAVVGLALLPATAIWFGHLPWLSPPANWLAVPWVSFAVVPLVLAGVVLLPVSPALAGWLWRWADTSLAGLMAALGWLEGQLGTLAVTPPSVAVTLLALIGVLYFLAPRGLPGRWLALPLLAGLLLMPAISPRESPRVVLFETGAGLTALIEADGHAVVYGGGPGGTLNAVEVALAPYLAARDLELRAWVVPRAEGPWSGAVAAARQRWPEIEWVSGLGCSGWQQALGAMSGGLQGGLQLETRRGAAGCELKISAAAAEGAGQPAPVYLVPELGSGPRDLIDTAFIIALQRRSQCEGACGGGKRCSADTSGGDTDLPDSPAAPQAAASPRAVLCRYRAGTCHDCIDSAEQGALTLSLAGSTGTGEGAGGAAGWRLSSEWERRARIFHGDGGGGR